MATETGRSERRTPGDRLGKWLTTFVAVVIVAGVLVALVNTAASAASQGMPKTWDMTEDWRADGWTCYRVDEGSASLTITPSPTYDRYRIILKGGSKFWEGKYRRVIFNAQAGTTYSGNQDISHYVWCGKDKDPSTPVTPKVKRGGGRILGPCGDPWYTARVWTGHRSAGPITYVVRVDGRIVRKRTVQPGDSLKFRPFWVRGGSLITVKRGNGMLVDRERSVSGTYPWTECRRG